jgi:cytochrome c2
MQKGRHMGRLAVVLITALVLLALWPLANAAQLKILPGSAAHGEELLKDKGCTNCHALNGAGGSRAPDLSKAPPNAGSPDLLASAMWNHAPAMWAGSASKRNSTITLSSAESADVFAYLYSVLFFSPPGDAVRGQNFFAKNCGGCHSGAPDAGVPVLKWSSATDPVIWAERMWNHSSEMQTAAARKRSHLPSLSSQDVADLLSYFRSLSNSRPHSPAFTMGDPERGLPVFERSCESCHSFGPSLANKIDLLQARAPSAVTGYIAEMWNHAPRMIGKNGARPPKLESGEMSDLIAFLFSQSYFFQRGNVGSGRRVFENKQCAVCHEERRKETVAPDLTQASEAYSPITLASAAWSHGPSMFHAMQQKGMSWPQFQGPEMTDLIAYLNSRVVPRIAPVQSR